MKYLRASFKNYIGFYNGMGLYEVDIDFRKCMHNIIIISGKNGSGKSTLMNHLNLFPDPSTSFIPNKTGEKHLSLIDNMNNIYNIQIVSPADLKGRKTTKAYIQKNGQELNPNGNISSYKEIIFSEFELDNNYISLSRLSNNDRGLGDKTPAERKRFVSSIVDHLEVYNDIYKTLNKKSLVYKSNLNNLHTKIQNIGSKDNLESSLKQLQSKERDLNNRIMNANNSIIAIQAKASIDEAEAIKIKNLNLKVTELLQIIESLESRMNALQHRCKIERDNIEEKYTETEKLYSSYKSKIDELTSIWKEKYNRLNSIESNITSIEAQVEVSYSSDIESRYDQSQAKLESIISELRSINIPLDTKVSDLYKAIIFCDKFATDIDHFNDGLTPSDLNYIINVYDTISLEELLSQSNSIMHEIEAKKQDLAEYQAKMKLLSILDSRPKECNIDTCPFISEAIETKKSNTDILEELSKMQNDILQLSDNLAKIQEKIEYHNNMRYKKMEIDTIKRSISNISPILSQYYPKFIANFDIMALNMNSFGFIKDHKLLTDASNLLKLYEAERDNNRLLEVEYKGYVDKIKLIKSSKDMLDKLKSEREELVINIDKIKSDINNFNSTLDNINSNISILSEYNNIHKEYVLKLSEYNSIKSQIDEFNLKSSKAMEELNSIIDFRKTINDLSAELEPIMQNIATISGQLTLLDSYYSEYNTYNQSYNIIETLKKYCSPTSGGIQTLFMQIYMAKTKDLANNVLGMLFGGSYQLCDFIINESEFRIPFIGEGLPVDDISSGSGAQIAMMGMIINLVLLHQASTRFNIAQLDEVTAALDSYNNSQFTNVLFHCMQILEIDQLFLISHSTETDNSYADIIKLKGYDNFESNFQSGNVIWDFNDIIKQ